MEKGEKTKRRVIAQAASVFNQHGFAGTTLSELMEATGLQKGGIYRHFAGKEELALEAFDHAFDVASRLRFEEIAEDVSAVEKLKQFVSNFARRRLPIPGGCPIWNTAVDCDDGNATLRERARSALQSWLNRLAEIAKEGQGKGDIVTEIDPHRLAALLVCSLEGALTAARLLGDEYPLVVVESHLHTYLDQTIACSRPSKSPGKKRSKD